MEVQVPGMFGQDMQPGLLQKPQGQHWCARNAACPFSYGIWHTPRMNGLLLGLHRHGGLTFHPLCSAYIPEPHPAALTGIFFLVYYPMTLLLNPLYISCSAQAAVASGRGQSLCLSRHLETESSSQTTAFWRRLQP